MSNHVEKEVFKQILAGKANRKVHGTYLLVVAVVLFSLLVVTGAMYPVPFTFHVACASNLGNPGLNPAAWWLFSVIFIACGPLIVPHYLFIYRNIYPVTKGLTNGMLVFLLVSAIGMVGVGIVNETTWIPHAILAGFIFAGVGLAMGLSLPIFIRKIQLGHDWPRPWTLIAMMATIFTFLGLMASEFILHDQGQVSSLNLAEWYAIFAIFTWIFGVYFLVRFGTKGKA